ncbi:MAG: hypothetical protein ACI9NC_003709, partial [Verrucomicrobiales bacterium]
SEVAKIFHAGSFLMRVSRYRIHPGAPVLTARV